MVIFCNYCKGVGSVTLDNVTTIRLLNEILICTRWLYNDVAIVA